MAITCITVMKAVTWGQVIDNAPKVVDGAKRLWSNVSRKPEPEEFAASGVQEPSGKSEDSSVINKRLIALEKTTADLHEQMVASSALIKELADQNTQLIARIEANRVRTAWLTAICVVMAIAALSVLAIVL